MPIRPTPRKPLRILMLGGTGFLGPHTVEAAIARGHTVTLFNRGITEDRKGGIFPDLEKRYGNRDPEKHADEKDPTSPKGLTELREGEWDAVVDTSGYVPRIVRASASLLAPRCGQYLFISSVSVYKSDTVKGADESDPVGTISDPSVETMGASFENYGPLKALCEQEAEKAFPGRATNIRPGLIVGPTDNTDRFTYWPVRVREGGDVLAPGAPDNPVQWVDVRDLGEWIIECLERRAFGVFNAICEPTGIGSLLQACKSVSGSDARFVWATPEKLREHNVSAWSDMPMWLPSEGEYLHANTRSNARAVKAGLKFRPAEKTIEDTLAWWDTLPAERRAKTRAGISREREAQVVKAIKG